MLVPALIAVTLDTSQPAVLLGDPTPYLSSSKQARR